MGLVAWGGAAGAMHAWDGIDALRPQAPRPSPPCIAPNAIPPSPGSPTPQHSLPTLACAPTLPPQLVQDTNSRSFVVRAYYRSRLFMGFCCICCEVLYLALYLLSWRQYQAPALALPALLQRLPLPQGAASCLMAVAASGQPGRVPGCVLCLATSSRMLHHGGCMHACVRTPHFHPADALPWLAALMRPLSLAPAGLRLQASIPAAAVMALVALPGFAVKQVVNVIQLRTAAQQLVRFDQQQDSRKAKR